MEDKIDWQRIPEEYLTGKKKALRFYSQWHRIYHRDRLTNAHPETVYVKATRVIKIATQPSHSFPPKKYTKKRSCIH